METTMLSRNGYSIAKTELSPEKIKEIKKELTFKPFDPTGITKFIDNTFGVFRETEDKIYVPRFYGIKKFGFPKKDKIFNKPDVIMNFKYTGIDKNDDPIKTKVQSEAIPAVVNELKKNGGGLLVLPCGMGKTFTFIKIWCQLKVKCLVLVHKEFLGEQIKLEIQALTDAKIGLIQGKTIDVKDKDIVICMIPSLARNDYSDYLKDFQMVVADECHHLGAEWFSTVLNKVCCKYMLGLSATPERDDKLDIVFMHYLGNIIYKFDELPNPNVIVNLFYYKNNGQPEYTEILNKFGKSNKSAMVSKLAEYQERNDFLIDRIAHHYKNKRNILALSGRCGKKTPNSYLQKKNRVLELIELYDNNKKITKKNKYSLLAKEEFEKNGRDAAINVLNNLLLDLDEKIKNFENEEKKYVKHLKILSEGLKNKHNIDSLIYVGGDPISKLDQMESLQVLFSTYNMVSEAFNLKKLNTLVYLTPISKITQIRGRIMRQSDPNFPPVIDDTIDCFSTFPNQSSKRISEYNRVDYQLKKYNYDNGKISDYQKKKENLKMEFIDND